MNWAKRSGDAIYASRWLLLPLSAAMLVVLAAYIVAFLVSDYEFIRHIKFDTESLMVVALSFADAYMVANLLLMIAQGSFQIFIQKFNFPDPVNRPSYLDHIDSGLLKVKIAQSVGGIMLVRLLEDYVNMEHVDWEIVKHRLVAILTTVVVAMIFAGIWRVTHPAWQQEHHETH
jgi:uncharacterized protein (TIGR00645 family)